MCFACSRTAQSVCCWVQLFPRRQTTSGRPSLASLPTFGFAKWGAGRVNHLLSPSSYRPRCVTSMCGAADVVSAPRCLRVHELMCLLGGGHAPMRTRARPVCVCLRWLCGY